MGLRTAFIGAAMTFAILAVANLFVIVSEGLLVRPMCVYVQTDITEMHKAVEAFKFNFRVDYLPSKITLGKFAGTKPGPGVVTDKESIDYMLKLFPGIKDDWFDPTKGIVWNHFDAGPTTLEGDECLVFFLGGPVDKSGMPQGWCTDPFTPTADRVNANPKSLDRKVFFEFEPKRLIRRYKGARRSAYLSYLDEHGSPYAYFSAREEPGSYSADCPTLRGKDCRGIEP